MHRHLAEKRRDDIIGEATIEILKKHGQISLESLLKKLKVMMHSEADIEKLEAIKTAVSFIAKKLHKSPGKSHAIYNGHTKTHYMPDNQFKKH